MIADQQERQSNLSRTILTPGLTFMTVIALFLFGAPVLNGLSSRW